MSLSSEITSAATEAQSTLAEIAGMASDAAGNFVGPDGAHYTMVFRAADAFESAAAAREMSLHGYQDRSVLVGVATRAQFSAAPLDWRRKHGTRLLPVPAREALIASVADDDPVFYVFVLLLRQS
jgi:hypothetical protein